MPETNSSSRKPSVARLSGIQKRRRIWIPGLALLARDDEGRFPISPLTRLASRCARRSPPSPRKCGEREEGAERKRGARRVRGCARHSTKNPAFSCGALNSIPERLLARLLRFFRRGFRLRVRLGVGFRVAFGLRLFFLFRLFGLRRLRLAGRRLRRALRDLDASSLIRPPNLLLKRDRRPPRSSSCCVPPVQAGCDFESISSCILSPGLPQVERVVYSVPSVIVTLIG